MRDGEGLGVLAQNIPVPTRNSAKFRRPDRLRGWRVGVTFHGTHPGIRSACEMFCRGHCHGIGGPALSYALDVALHDACLAPVSALPSYKMGAVCASMFASASKSRTFPISVSNPGASSVMMAAARMAL